jgi:hypothetical protein
MDVNIDSVRTVDLTIEKRPQVSRMEIVDSGRRRRFSKEAKLAIVAESYSAPRQVTVTARRHGMVIPPFLTGLRSRIHAAIFSFCAGVMPPMPILGRSLLYVHSHCVANSCASSMLSMMYWSSHSCRTVRL